MHDASVRRIQSSSTRSAVALSGWSQICRRSSFRKWGHLAQICCLHPTPDTTRREVALGLARKAVDLTGPDKTPVFLYGHAPFGGFVRAC
jgi:hypothetical protein